MPAPALRLPAGPPPQAASNMTMIKIMITTTTTTTTSNNDSDNNNDNSNDSNNNNTTNNNKTLLIIFSTPEVTVLRNQHFRGQLRQLHTLGHVGLDRIITHHTVHSVPLYPTACPGLAWPCKVSYRIRPTSYSSTCTYGLLFSCLLCV